MKMNTGARSQKPEARSSNPDFRVTALGLQPSAFSLQPFRRGVALIITLILLSVVLFMAITFLALSRRERNAVSTVTDTAGARYAADAALANAEAQIIANVLSTTNPYNFGLIVSTNYINPRGFQPGVSSFTNVNYDYRSDNATYTLDDFLQNLTNLFYSPRPPVFVTTNGAGSNEFRFYLDLNRNGRFDPNSLQPVVSSDPLNPYFNTNGFPIASTFPGNTVSNVFVGDPEWIGILERPDAPYGPNNKFIARYAFIAIPVGNTLDLNAIHNQTLDTVGNRSVAPPDVYFRNQGVGSWEINLAAFLADLNTNKWDNPFSGGAYQYRQPNFANIGMAFDDARAFLVYRYTTNYSSLASVDSLFGGPAGPGHIAFRNDNIDGYSDGRWQTTVDTNADFAADNPALPWAGAVNTNHFFTHQELFDTNKTSPLFYTNLWSAGTSNSTYDRYTFYRLLAQLGTDTAPESGKMNLNYMNVDTNGNVIPGMETNFLSWTNALQFFTNAADRLLRAYTTQWRSSDPTNFAATFYAAPTFLFTNINFVNPDQWTNYPAFGIGHIPVWVTNQFVYSAAVNRLLQLAANLYDATATNVYPSIFRPVFSRDADTSGNAGKGINLFITGYVLQIDPIASGNETNALDLALPIDPFDLSIEFGPVINQVTNVYGVPWIIGAKKGFPNFNEFALESSFQIARKLQFTRNTNTSPFQYASNQMYIMSITNFYGAECWNSYTSSFPRFGTGPVGVMTRASMGISLANDTNFLPVVRNFLASSVVTFSSWPGYNNNLGLSSFVLPFSTNAYVLWLTNSVYNYGPITMNGYSPPFNPPCFIPTLINPSNYLNSGTPPLPHFILSATNRLQVAIIDYSAGLNQGRIIDYVQLNNMDSRRDLNLEIADPDDYGLWSTNLTNGMTFGVVNQINYSRFGSPALPAEDSDEGGAWSTASIPGLPFTTKSAEQQYFNKFFAKNLSVPIDLNGTIYNATYTTTNLQAPYTPVRTRVQRVTWQADDPLVHYLGSDLTDTMGDTNTQHILKWPDNIGLLNTRYMPWGGYPGVPGNLNTPDFNATTAYDLRVKDPLVGKSDDWDFPTNKLPGVGWIGRIHRGTPWQTIYLKAQNILGDAPIINGITNHPGTNTWVTLTGDQNHLDAANMAPIRDRLLFDLFTTALNDNATRGTLSVNVGPTNANLAAWSALLSGMVVLTNTAPNDLVTPTNTWLTIEPAGNYYNPGLALTRQPALVQIVQAINQKRATFTNADGLAGTFEHAGDILSVAQLTDQSPFLNWNNVAQQQSGISEEMYEWLPQQAMSLLRCSSSPRYVIYCYGQTLKPAPNGVYNGLGNRAYAGMVTNYQVVSEIATRVVVRFGSMVTNVVVGTNNLVVGTNWFTVPVVTNNNAVIENFNPLPPD